MFSFLPRDPLLAQPRERPASRESIELRLQELEQWKAETEKTQKKEIEKEIAKEVKKSIVEAAKEVYSKGVITIGAAELRLGGKLELNFVDTESEHDSLLGTTDNPDPHLEFDRLRLEPELDVGKAVGIRGQLDFRPDRGNTLLKEMSFFHDWKHEWWFRTESQIGLDDRFIHIGPSARLSETYPLLGTAFWRDEEIALMWKGTIGNKRGAKVEKPVKPAKAPKPPRRRSAPAAEDEAPPALEEVNGRASQTSSTEHEPFDFENNPGALVLHFSVGDGHTLGVKEIGKDQANLQEIVQDDRNVKTGLSLRELGFGIGYERDFNFLGELDFLFFFFDNRLNQDSIDFLQDGLTVRDLAGIPTAGYGNSEKDYQKRIGFSAGYHLEAYHLLRDWLDLMDTRKGDGLYAFFQYIDAQDGNLDRDGWYVQGSYRLSFPKPLIDNYFHYVEPTVRYGVLDVRMDQVPSLPGTWDRRQFLVGGVLSVTKKIYIKTEYVFNRESTGAGAVDSNELIVQLLINF